MAENVPLPRNFKLLEEYDCCIGKKDHASLITGEHQGFINYGLDEAKDDIFLHYWQGMIFGPQGKQTGECVYLFTVYCPDNYPQVPPKIHIKEPKLAMAAVDSKGDVDLNKLKPSFHWNSNLNIADTLMALRNNICDSDVARNSAALINQRYG